LLRNEFCQDCAVTERRSVDSHWVGVILVGIGAIVSSTSGLLVRQIEAASTWQIVFYRALFLMVGVSVVFIVRHGRYWVKDLRASARVVLLVGPVQGCSSMCFVFALTHTTVANTMLVLSAVPLITSLMSRVLLKDKVLPATIGAMLVAAGGMLLMSIDGITNGNLFGTALALLNAFGYALYLVLIRRFSYMDMLPAIVVGAVSAALISGSLADSLSITTHDFIVCMAWGGFAQCGALVLITLGSKYIRPTELSFFGTIENVLSPTWVWLIVGEVPTLLAAIGGSIITGAVVLWMLLLPKKAAAVNAKMV